MNLIKYHVPSEDCTHWHLAFDTELFTLDEKTKLGWIFCRAHA